MTDDGIVYLAVTTSGGYSGVYHSNKNCSAVAHARSLVEKPRSVLYDHFRECQVCRGESNGGGSTTPHATQQLLESLDPDSVGPDPSGEVDNGGGSA